MGLVDNLEQVRTAVEGSRTCKLNRVTAYFIYERLNCCDKDRGWFDAQEMIAGYYKSGVSIEAVVANGLGSVHISEHNKFYDDLANKIIDEILTRRALI